MSESDRRDFLKFGLASLAVGSQVLGSRADASPSETAGKLNGKVALVTGAARGIGAVSALELASRGADLALLDILDNSEVSETERKIRELGRKATHVRADVRNLEKMKSAAQKFISEFGRIDILVANAGIAPVGPFSEMNPGRWDEVMGINLTGVANSIWSVLPQMKKQKSGRIIVMSSIAGRMGLQNMACYSASKWGTIGLVKSLALELGKDNITVNGIAPSAVNTVGYRGEGTAHKEQDEAMSKFHALPVPALEPIDVANVVAFLSGSEARYISGAILDVTAGGGAHYTA